MNIDLAAERRKRGLPDYARKANRMTLAEIREATGLSQGGVQYYIRTGALKPERARIPGRVTGWRWEVPREQAEAFIEQRRAS